MGFREAVSGWFELNKHLPGDAGQMLFSAFTPPRQAHEQTPAESRTLPMPASTP